MPLFFTGPESSQNYFNEIDDFIGATLGTQAQKLYEIIIEDPIQVAKKVSQSMENVVKNRRNMQDAYYYNWSLHIDPIFQNEFIPTHENMAQLNLHTNQDSAKLAANLRRAFSGIVAGNIKPEGINAIRKHGVFYLQGEPQVMQKLDTLLTRFISQGRMKLSGEYKPCYKI